MHLKILALAAFLAVVPVGDGIAGEKAAYPQRQWSFDGVFGTFDQHQLQRGLQVYKEVCSTCHSLNLVAFRDLVDLGYGENEIKAFAAQYTVRDGPNEEGEMFDRPALPSDRFVPPYPNVQAAQAANNGAYPVDLSLVTKAREDGTNYVHALLNGYAAPPPGFALGSGMSYNRYFKGHAIAMPAPLTEDAVTYADGTSATVEQMATDVAAFLTWTAEPKLQTRKQTGVRVMLFLLVMTVLFYLAKRKAWSHLK